MEPVTFPGRQVVLDRFERTMAGGRLAQSYLFVGPEGSGKEVTALEIARLANCVRPGKCAGDDLCESCRKALTFQHPDIRCFGPAPAATDETEVARVLAARREDHFYRPSYAGASMITIGDTDHPGPLTMRSLIRFLQRTAFQGRFKVTIVAEGQRMNAATANSFLKTLEEPSPGSLIFLLTSNRAALLPTIISRCQQIRFGPWDQQELETLLRERYSMTGDEASAAARLADGDARRAIALLDPEARALQNWADRIFTAVHDDDDAQLRLAAAKLHDGEIPADFVPDDCEAAPGAAPDLATRRQRVIRLCEMLNLYYSESLVAREMGEAWQPRLTTAADGIAARSARRRSVGLLADLKAIETTKGEIAGNLNIGLTMTMLFRRLKRHVETD